MYESSRQKFAEKLSCEARLIGEQKSTTNAHLKQSGCCSVAGNEAAKQKLPAAGFQLRPNEDGREQAASYYLL
jgi:hypothetical protein